MKEHYIYASLGLISKILALVVKNNEASFLFLARLCVSLRHENNIYKLTINGK